MIYLDDQLLTQKDFNSLYTAFEINTILANSDNIRFTICTTDTAVLIALCLYMKNKGGSAFPLPAGTPRPAALKRAIRSGSHYLLYGNSLDDVLNNIEKVCSSANDTESVLIQMSSGTTGTPKVISRSWADINEEVCSYVAHFSEANDMTPVIACPISHSYGLICGLMVALERGVVPVVIQNLNPKYIIKKVRQHKNSILYSSPALIGTISMLIDKSEPVHAIMSSGTLLQPKWFDMVKTKSKFLFQQYGCSETGCISIGKNIDNYDEIGLPLPYLNVSSGSNPDQAEEIVVTNSRDEVIKTRDIGYFDDTGSLHFISRIDDMINVAGLNVYPSEVEDVILELADIQDAVVFKSQQASGSDQVCLQYVSSEVIKASVIRKWCRQNLASHQIPMVIQRVDKIARKPNGKVSRKELAESLR
tara:strand:+ start:811 stop:2067 length:1257 start_codon:yes stop_codon:yes gene_type:complete